MHLSTHNWMRAEPLEVSTLTRASRSSATSRSRFPASRNSTRPSETRALLKEHGIRCWGSVTLMLGERNLAAKDQGQRERSVQYVKDVLTMVSELDGEIITLVPATVGKVVPDGTEEEEWKWVVDATRECFTHAKKVGVRIAVEPLNRFETYLFNRGEQALALADAVSPNAASASTPITSTWKSSTSRKRSARPASACSTSTSPTTTASPPASAPSTGRSSSASCATSAMTAR
jgi:sugar phosphate isomerase/epimerase